MPNKKQGLCALFSSGSKRDEELIEGGESEKSKGMKILYVNAF